MRPDTLARQAAEAELTLYAHRRAAIDAIATMRARMIRAALFGTYLQRPNPGRRETAADRQAWRDILAEQFAAMERGCALLHGTDPEEVVPPEICAWIAEEGRKWPEHVGIMEHACRLTGDVVEAAATGGDALNDALQAHFEFGRREFYHAVTAFCDGLWAGLDSARHEEVQRARETADTIAHTLQRLQHIGKHVRLVSLNASVEAARVGDAGKGLGVIAVEFKSLAEEIQHLAVTARDRINGLTGAD